MLLPRFVSRVATVLSLGVAVLICAPDAYAQFGLPANVNLGIGTPPAVISGVATGDLDNDGRGDIVGVDSANPGNIGLALGIGGGLYSVQTVVPGGALGSPTGLATPQLADFDNDGFLDLAASGTNSTGTDTAVFIYQGVPGAGTYTFVLQQILPVAPLPGEVTGLRTTDFTNDGLQEFLATNDSSLAVNQLVGLRRNLGGFVFGPMVSQSTATGASDIDICVDFNGDQLKDLVICRPISAFGPAGVDLYAGVGTPFQPQFPFIPPTPTISLQMPPGFSPKDVHFIECDFQNGYDLVIGVDGPIPGIFVLRNLGPPNFFASAALLTPFISTGVPVSVLRAESTFDGVEDLLVYGLNPSGPVLKSATFDLFEMKNCIPTLVSATQAGAADTTAANQEKLAPQAVGDQQFDGQRELLVVDHSTPGGSTINVYTNNTPTEFTISPDQPTLGQVTPIRFKIEIPNHAGSPFFLLFSTAGPTPGTPIGGGLVLPLNLPLFPVVFQGTLSAAGDGSFGTPAVTFPSAPVTFSLQMAGAVVVMSSAGAGPVHVTNPATITLP